MFDSQKMSFEDFLLDYKHGVYIFSRDVCLFCEDYKKSIEYVNNGNLYFVEVRTEKEMAICEKLFNRSVFPLTVGYEDNDLEFVRAGVLSDIDVAEWLKFLERFGDKPLDEIEKKKRIEKYKAKCVLTYYVFPPECPEEIRYKWMNEYCYKHNELPIDVEKVGLNLTDEEKERMLSGNYKFARMVVFSDDNTNIYSEFAQRIIIGYAIANKEVTFIKRSLEDIK